MQSLGQLKPSFVQMGTLGGFDAVATQAHPEIEAVNHVHHAGNSSGIVDGAAAVLIGSKDAGEAAGLKPRVKIKAFANIGSEPAIMLTGPVDVTEKVLRKAGMTLDDIDLIEINEAFASVVLRYLQAFDLDSAQGQRQWRRDRDGPSARRHRRHDPRHRDRRARASRPRHRAGDAVYRRRHGHRHHHRAGVTYDNEFRPCGSPPPAKRWGGVRGGGLLLKEQARRKDARVPRSRGLRRAMTVAERKLWNALRVVPIDGTHFRRQATIGPYFADFACHQTKLVIEVDGGTHGEDNQMAADMRRTAFLMSHGYRVLRFWNNDVLRNVEGVMTAIHDAIDERRRSAPHP